MFHYSLISEIVDEGVVQSAAIQCQEVDPEQEETTGSSYADMFTFYTTTEGIY